MVRGWLLFLAVGVVACGETRRGSAPSLASAGDTAGDSSPGGAPDDLGSGGSAGSTTATPPAGRCPDSEGSSPQTAAQCPSGLPDGGVCCETLGLVCEYPGMEANYHMVALCQLGGEHGAYWQQRVAIDEELCQFNGRLRDVGAGAEACAARMTVPCEATGITTRQELLTGQISDLLNTCDSLPSESTLEVRFENGCATQLSDSLSGPPADNEALLNCLSQALNSRHFACAEQLTCARLERSTLK